jgi:hypothetical protein
MADAVHIGLLFSGEDLSQSVQEQRLGARLAAACIKDWAARSP